MGVVYCITNNITNKEYVGIDITDIGRRWKDHIRRGKKDPVLLVDKRIKHYGICNFSYRVLYRSNDYEDIKSKETHFIKKLGTYITDGGYNLTFGGDHNPMFDDIVRARHKKIMAEKTGGVNHYMYGKKRKESMKKIRANTVNPFTLTHVRKILSDIAKHRTGDKNTNFRHSISCDDLYKYYIKESHTLDETANYFKCSEATITRNLRKYSIKKDKLEIDESVLWDLRFNRRLTIKQCANFFGCSVQPIKTRLRKLGEYYEI